MAGARYELEKFITDHIHGPGLSNENALEAKKLLGQVIVDLKIKHASVAHDGIMCYNLTIKDEKSRRIVAEGISIAIKESRS